MHAVVAGTEQKRAQCVDSHVRRSQHVFRRFAVPAIEHANAGAFCCKSSRPSCKSENAEKDETSSGDTIYDTSSPSSVPLGERSGCMIRFLDIVAVG